MGSYELIRLDKTEQSVVRRALHQWNKADEQAIKPLVLAVQQRNSLSTLHFTEPQWETNVYPLYYWAHGKGGGKKARDYVWDHLRTWFPTVSGAFPPEHMRVHVRAMVNSEIDILVEDADYFLFVEAKLPSAPNKFPRTQGVHQLVRQYVQGRILVKLIKEDKTKSKTFVLATIGANGGETIRIDLNPTEQELLRLVGEERESLEVFDLPWSLLTTTEAHGD